MENFKLNVDESLRESLNELRNSKEVLPEDERKKLEAKFLALLSKSLDESLGENSFVSSRDNVIKLSDFTLRLAIILDPDSGFYAEKDPIKVANMYPDFPDTSSFINEMDDLIGKFANFLGVEVIGVLKRILIEIRSSSLK